MSGIPGFGFLDEIIDQVLSITPEHDAGRETRLLENAGDVGGPKMEHLNAGGLEKDLYPRVIIHSPSNSELSGTRGGYRRGIGWAGAGRAAAQRGRRRRITLGGSIVAALGRRVRWLRSWSTRRWGAGR